MNNIFLILLSIMILQSCCKKESVLTTFTSQDQNTDSTSQDTIDYFIGTSYISYIAVGGCSTGIPPHSDPIPDTLFVVYYPDDSMQLNANNGSWMYQSNDSGYYQGSEYIPTLVLTSDSAFLDVLISTSYCPFLTEQGGWGYNQLWTIYNFNGKKNN